MDIEDFKYKNGARLFELHHEKSHFDQMLERYEQKAKSYFSLQNSGKYSEEERAEKLTEALRHLEHEKRHLAAMASVQAQLELYREEGMRIRSTKGVENKNLLNMMIAEKHHGTEILEMYMRAEAVPKPSPQHTAHHIVPGRGKLRVITAQIRLHLHLHGIRINDPANGVYLVGRDEDSPHWSMPDSRGHKKYHTHEYEKWISSRLRPIKGTDFLKTQLQLIGKILQSNEPKSALKR